MKNNNKIISVNSSLGKDKHRKNKNQVMKTGNPQNGTNSLAKLHTAVILIPIAIVLSMIIVLVIAFHQYWASVETGSVKQPDTSSSSHIHPSDEKKLLTLVSPKSPLPSDYQIDLAEYEGIPVDAMILEPLNSLMTQAKKDGLSLIVIGGYVSAQEQNDLYQEELRRLVAREGQSSARAAEEAELRVPMGNHADAQTGLSVRFASGLTDNFEQSNEYLWLTKNSYKYGFILRYPENKTKYTDIAFDPSLFRYVGVDNALKMQTLNMCLDEYMIYLNAR